MIKNLILLTGDDDFRLRERVSFYRKAFGQKYPNGTIGILEKDRLFSDLENMCCTPSLFGEKRLIITEEFWTAEKFEQAQKSDFFEKLPNFIDEITLLSVEMKLDKRLKCSKFLLENVKKEEFHSFDEMQTVRWIEQYTKKKGGIISHHSAQELFDRCGLNLWNLSREIQKLLTAGENEITSSLIQALTLPHPSIVLWTFLENLSKKNVQRAMKTWKEILLSGTSVHEIFPMILREIRIHALIRNGIEQNLNISRITEMTKLHPFVVKKTYPLTKKFSKKEIEILYDELFEIEQKIKTGKISISTDDTSEFELAIEKFILHACQP
jgi:DNA polymerase III delta subunit